ncbi:hypothetical protein [Roseomonas genomospecies 6]|nr:hypothetical protein [Roseomonas genomospecies 6]
MKATFASLALAASVAFISSTAGAGALVDPAQIAALEKDRQERMLDRAHDQMVQELQARVSQNAVEDHKLVPAGLPEVSQTSSPAGTSAAPARIDGTIY